MKTGLFGFWFHHDGNATFVLDSSQLDRVQIPFRGRDLSADELLDMMQVALKEYDAVYFEGVNTTVEPVVNTRSAPRFIVLRKKTDDKLSGRLFDAAGGEDVCVDTEGNTIYEIVAFADSSLELNRILYADENHGFPHATLKKSRHWNVTRR